MLLLQLQPQLSSSERKWDEIPEWITHVGFNEAETDAYSFRIIWITCEQKIDNEDQTLILTSFEFSINHLRSSIDQHQFLHWSHWYNISLRLTQITYLLTLHYEQKYSQLFFYLHHEQSQMPHLHVPLLNSALMFASIVSEFEQDNRPLQGVTVADQMLACQVNQETSKKGSLLTFLPHRFTPFTRDVSFIWTTPKLR